MGGVRNKGTARVIAFNAGFILLGIILVEAIFGNWFSGAGFGYLNVPRNVVLKHDMGRIRSGAGIAVYRKDQYGFRGNYGKPSDIGVLVIGGSTTNELYVGEGNTWVDILSKELKRHGKNLSFANGGVDGHSTVGHIKSFDMWYSRIPGLRPRYVLFYVGINDVHVESQALYDSIEPTARTQRMARYVKNNSALYYLYQTLRGIYRARKVRVVYQDAPPKVHVIPQVRPIRLPDKRERLSRYEERLRALAARSRKLGAKPIFVTQRRGDAYYLDGVWYASSLDAIGEQAKLALYNRTTLAVCRDVGGICVDLASKIQLRAENFSDNIHTNAAGSRLIGQFLATELKNKL